MENTFAICFICQQTLPARRKIYLVGEGIHAYIHGERVDRTSDLVRWSWAGLVWFHFHFHFHSPLYHLPSVWRIFAFPRKRGAFINIPFLLCFVCKAMCVCFKCVSVFAAISVFISVIYMPPTYWGRFGPVFGFWGWVNVFPEPEKEFKQQV